MIRRARVPCPLCRREGLEVRQALGNQVEGHQGREGIGPAEGAGGPGGTTGVEVDEETRLRIDGAMQAGTVSEVL
jgi:hypothetical protein